LEEIIKQLSETYGPAGVEGEIRSLIESMIQPHVDDMRQDALGNLIARKSASSSQPAGRLMLAAHMDEIGLMVSFIDRKGFARFHSVGGVWPAPLVGSRVLFQHGVVGVIGVEKLAGVSELSSMDKLYMDVGATSAEDSPIQVGDVGVFVRSFVAQGNRWIAKAMDDRIGCAILIEFLRQVERSAYDIYAVFTAQEEVGTRGATVSAYGIEPDVALALDVTLTGDTPESSKMAVELGKGPAIKVKDSGMITHAGLRRHMIECARSAGVSYQLEVLNAGSTDGRAIQMSRAGVPTGVLSIPCRYVHTPSEMVDAGDVRDTVKLLLEIVKEPIKLV